MWGKRGEGLNKCLSKGSRIYVEGELRTSSYEKDGDKRYKTEVVASNVLLLDGKPGGRPRDDDDDDRGRGRDDDRGRDRRDARGRDDDRRRDDRRDDRGRRDERSRDDRPRDDRRERARDDDRGRAPTSTSREPGDDDDIPF